MALQSNPDLRLLNGPHPVFFFTFTENVFSFGFINISTRFHLRFLVVLLVKLSEDYFYILDLIKMKSSVTNITCIYSMQIH